MTLFFAALSRVFWRSDPSSFKSLVFVLVPFFSKADFIDFITSFIFFFQKRLCFFFCSEARKAFFDELVFGIGRRYDNINPHMVKSVLKNGSDFLMKTQNTIISAAVVLALAGGVNAGLGLLKGRLLTYYFGVSDELGIFYTADRIPSLIYSVLTVGALSTVFIPVFADIIKNDRERAWRTASSVINISLIVFSLVALFFFIFSPQVLKLLSIGTFNSEQVLLGANLMRIMLFSQLLLIVGSFITGILQTHKFFLVPALAPVLYSLGMIAGLIIFAPLYGIYAPVIGVVIGSVFYVLIQIPLVRKIGFKYKFSLDIKDKSIRELFKLMPPRILSVFLVNVVYTINNSLAILISLASVTILKNAIQLQFFPVNLFGISIASAALPSLSEESGELENDGLSKFKKTFLTSFHQMMFMVIPASVVLLVLRIPVVRIVYGVSNYPWEATVKTSYALAFFSLSIFSQSAVYLITRAFYALKDTLTPIKVFVFTIVLNVLLSVTLVKMLGFGIWSIAFSYSLTSLIDMSVLFYLLSKKVGGFSKEKVLIPFTKISYSALLMGIALYIPLKLLDKYVFDTTRTINLLILTFIVSTAGSVSYLLFTKLLKVEEIELFYKLLRKLNLHTNIPSPNIENA